MPHQAPADLQAIIDAGRRDVPEKDLHFRCTKCGSRRTDSVVMATGALRVTPWQERKAPPGDDAGARVQEFGASVRRVGSIAQWPPRVDRI